MSDKEFDKVFQDGFEDFSVMPSKPVWSSIEAGLENKKRNRFPLFWTAAACVTVVLIAGLYLFRPKHKVWLHGEDNRMTRVQPEQKMSAPAAIELTSIAKKPDSGSALKEKAVIVPDSRELNKADHTPEKKSGSVLSVNKVAAKIETHESHPIIQQAIVAVPDEKREEGSASLSDSVFRSTPAMANSSRIRSVGGLVNFVIAKVDRREDKIIELSDNDEGTSITGINIGVLKIKSGNNKKERGFKVNFK